MSVEVVLRKPTRFTRASYTSIFSSQLTELIQVSLMFTACYLEFCINLCAFYEEVGWLKDAQERKGKESIQGVWPEWHTVRTV